MADRNWEGYCFNCGSEEEPVKKKDADGVYFECPDCLSHHDNRDNLTGDCRGEE